MAIRTYSHTAVKRGARTQLPTKLAEQVLNCQKNFRFQAQR